VFLPVSQLIFINARRQQTLASATHNKPIYSLRKAEYDYGRADPVLPLYFPSLKPFDNIPSNPVRDQVTLTQIPFISDPTRQKAGYPQQ
jgi:hypothetical protein